jgi:hypothetical protein
MPARMLYHQNLFSEVFYMQLTRLLSKQFLLLMCMTLVLMGKAHATKYSDILLDIVQNCITQEAKNYCQKCRAPLAESVCESEKTCKKISQTHIKLGISVGEKNGMYGKKHSKESIEKNKENYVVVPVPDPRETVVAASPMFKVVVNAA